MSHTIVILPQHLWVEFVLHAWRIFWKTVEQNHKIPMCKLIPSMPSAVACSTVSFKHKQASWGHNWEPLGLWKPRLSRRNKHQKKIYSQFFHCWIPTTLHIRMWMLDSMCTQRDFLLHQFGFLSVFLIENAPQLPIHSSQFGLRYMFMTQSSW